MSLTAILQLATALCVAAQAAPPSSPHFFSATHRGQISPLDYYMDSPEMVNYYTLAQQKNVPVRTARLETLDPDSEVELVPAVQTPQQPLQPPQPPVAGNIPGLVPGQRVFIVHMPVPGYRPGTIGGYQPVYIVAAAPQGHYAGGYQNTLLLDPSLQVISPMQLRAEAPLPSVPTAPLPQPENPVLLGYNAVNFLYNPKNYRGVGSSPGLAEQTRLAAVPPPSTDHAPEKEAVTGSEARRSGHKGGHEAVHEAKQEAGHEAGQSGSEETRESLEDTHNRAEDASIAHEHQSSDEGLHEDMPLPKLRHKHPKPASGSEETKDASVEEIKSINATSVLRYDGSKNIAEGSRGGGDAVQLYLLTKQQPDAGAARNSSQQAVQPVQAVQLVQLMQPVQPVQSVQLVQPVQPVQPVQLVNPVTLATSVKPMPAIKSDRLLDPAEQDAQTDQSGSEESTESTEEESDGESTTAHNSAETSGESARLLSGEDLEAQREVLRQQLRDMIDRIREQQRVQRKGNESNLDGGKQRRVAKSGERTARPAQRRQDPAPCTRHHAARLQPGASLTHLYSG